MDASLNKRISLSSPNIFIYIFSLGDVAVELDPEPILHAV